MKNKTKMPTLTLSFSIGLEEIVRAVRQEKETKISTSER